MALRPIYENNLPKAREVKPANYEEVIKTYNVPKTPIPKTLVAYEDHYDDFTIFAQVEIEDNDYLEKKVRRKEKKL